MQRPSERPESTVELEHNSIEEGEKIIEGMPDRPEIKTVARNRACYAPAADIVEIPEMNSFLNAEYYYDTLFHELVHSTGHEKRLDRKNNIKNAFGSSEYSKEELVAEIGGGKWIRKTSIWIFKYKKEDELCVGTKIIG